MRRTRIAQKRGGTIRVGATKAGSSFEPVLLREAGSLAFASLTGEYLTFSNQQLQVRPALATSWKPNRNATVWTFQLRRGVKFHNGKTIQRGRRRRELQAVHVGDDVGALLGDSQEPPLARPA